MWYSEEYFEDATTWCHCARTCEAPPLRQQGTKFPAVRTSEHNGVFPTRLTKSRSIEEELSLIGNSHPLRAFYLINCHAIRARPIRATCAHNIFFLIFFDQVYYRSREGNNWDSDWWYMIFLNILCKHVHWVMIKCRRVSVGDGQGWGNTQIRNNDLEWNRKARDLLSGFESLLLKATGCSRCIGSSGPSTALRKSYSNPFVNTTDQRFKP